MQVLADAKVIAHEAATEAADASPGQRLELGVTAVALAAEWGTGNEALIGLTASNVFAITHNAAMTTLASGGASLIEQTALGLLASVLVGNFPRTAEAIRNRFFGGESTGDTENESRRAPIIGRAIGRFVTVLALGTAVPVIFRNLKQPRSFGENARNVLTDAALISLGVMAIVGVSAGAVSTGESMGWREQAQAVVNVAKSPLTYASLLGLKLAWDGVRGYLPWHRQRVDGDIAVSAETYDQGQELFVSPDGEYRVSVHATVGRNDRDALFRMIKDGFVQLNAKSAQAQDMTRDEFERDLDAVDVLKYIARDSAGQPVGFMTAHVGLESVTWLDQPVKDAMIDQQREADPGMPPLYVGTLVVPEELRATAVAPALLRGGLEHWRQIMDGEGQSLLFFDCAEANYPTLPKLIAWLARPAKGFKGIPLQIEEMANLSWFAEDTLPGQRTVRKHLDTQHYFVVHRRPAFSV